MSAGVMRAFLSGLMAAFWLTGALAADERVDAEVEYLLTRIGESECVFIRNGKDHTAADAEEHLRMKYRKGRRWVDDSGQFIDRIASESSWTGEPYRVRCSAQGEPELTRDWLRRLLSEYPLPPA